MENISGNVKNAEVREVMQKCEDAANRGGNYRGGSIEVEMT